MNGVQVDPNKLTDFAKRMTDLVSYFNNTVVPAPVQLQFGFQEVRSFTDAQTLQGLYQTKAGDVQNCYQAFLAELGQLSSAAAALAKQYGDAALADQVNAQSVDQALGSLPSTTPGTK